MSANTPHIPSFLKQFRSMKFDLLLQDLPKLSKDQLEVLKKEIEILLEQKK
ncbi:hypothetical protein [Shimazuella alba]|jgi:hypothetical protein|uniref:Uncharacterized protein n=1 Tax=Shimazuella alba TaxID=2690964 RepID=A0A6I4VV26_9BACL|nr:hypothetical protein [Shimazuella alba]MXQ54381.1 hypothetical protein [Shimazuella alba]